MTSNFNAEPAPGPHPSATGLTPHEYELLILTSAAVCDAQRAHDDAARELEAWRTILDKVA